MIAGKHGSALFLGGLRGQTQQGWAGDSFQPRLKPGVLQETEL